MVANAVYSKVGADFDAPASAVSFKLGECAQGEDGTEWVYGQASGAVAQYSCVAIDENFQIAAATGALVQDGHRVGFAQAAFTDNQYGWVACRGSNVNCLVRGNAAADKELWTTASAGVLDDASASGQRKIKGVLSVAGGGTSAGANVGVEVIATYPHVDLV